MEEGLIKNLESEVKNGERCMYFVCDFNGRWLNDSNPLYRIFIVLNVGGIVSYVM